MLCTRKCGRRRRPPLADMRQHTHACAVALGYLRVLRTLHALNLTLLIVTFALVLLYPSVCCGILTPTSAHELVSEHGIDFSGTAHMRTFSRSRLCEMHRISAQTELCSALGEYEICADGERKCTNYKRLQIATLRVAQ